MNKRNSAIISVMQTRPENPLRHPVHFFDQFGVAALNYKHLVEMLVARDKEIDRLRRLLAAKKRQLEN